jgi:hypothetical protein
MIPATRYNYDNIGALGPMGLITPQVPYHPGPACHRPYGGPYG